MYIGLNNLRTIEINIHITYLKDLKDFFMITSGIFFLGVWGIFKNQQSKEILSEVILQETAIHRLHLPWFCHIWNCLAKNQSIWRTYASFHALDTCGPFKSVLRTFARISFLMWQCCLSNSLTPIKLSNFWSNKKLSLSMFSLRIFLQLFIYNK